MKKILFAALIAAMTFVISVLPSTDVKAQSSYSTSRTITTADTITWTNAPSKIVGFQYTYIETSGTTAGKVYLEGTINGTWVALDSLTLVDAASPAIQTKVVTIAATAGTSYKSYRFRNTNTSSATGAVVATMLRRFDDR